MEWPHIDLMPFTQMAVAHPIIGSAILLTIAALIADRQQKAAGKRLDEWAKKRRSPLDPNDGIHEVFSRSSGPAQGIGAWLWCSWVLWCYAAIIAASGRHFAWTGPALLGLYTFEYFYDKLTYWERRRIWRSARSMVAGVAGVSVFFLLPDGVHSFAKFGAGASVGALFYSLFNLANLDWAVDDIVMRLDHHRELRQDREWLDRMDEKMASAKSKKEKEV